MRTLLKAGFILIAYAITSIGMAAAQAPHPGCSIESSTFVAQTLRCEGGVTIVVENGARYSLLGRARRGRVDGVELNSKAVLIDVPARSGIRFQVITPQAIAAVRGTRWAVDAAESKTSVFVAAGRVAVGRRTGGHSVTLGAGEGVDVEEGGAPLVVKRWSETRVSALMARLGQ
jgi:ferric-dicitrate binding protein FerR (iron transport regulator)